MDHIEDHTRTFTTTNFAWNDLYSPNTTGVMTDACISLLNELSPMACKLYYRCISKLVRSTDPALAIVIHMHHTDCSDFLSRATYFKYFKELKDHRLILNTPKRGVYIVNVQFFSKLYKTRKALE